MILRTKIFLHSERLSIRQQRSSPVNNVGGPLPRKLANGPGAPGPECAEDGDSENREEDTVVAEPAPRPASDPRNISCILFALRTQTCRRDLMDYRLKS